LNLARVCRNLNSWGCRVGCAIPDGMVTDVHMSVGDAQQCSKATEMQMCVSQTYDASCSNAGLALSESAC